MHFVPALYKRQLKTKNFISRKNENNLKNVNTKADKFVIPLTCPVGREYGCADLRSTKYRPVLRITKDLG